MSAPNSAKPTVLGRGLTLLMAIASGVAVANIYYNQPMLGIIERDFAASRLTGLIPMVTQLGYAAGLFLFVPLGDIMDRRKLIVGQFLVLAAALVMAALAPSAAVLVTASLLVGATATVAQQVLPFAASLAAPEARGRTIGTVMSGVLCGLLLSRTLSGFVGSHFGWREMFWLGVPLAIGMSVLMAVVLPRNHPHSDIPYGTTLRSMVTLWREEPALRGATLRQAMLFATFSVFWSVLALHLEEPAFHFGADIAGLFGILGAVGVFVAPLAGRLADRRGPFLVILGGSALTLVAWALFGLWNALAGLVIGVIVLDFGMQVALISNQYIMFALRPEARNRLNTIFMTGMFLAGATGSAGATAMWNWGGWPAVCVLGAAFSVASLVLFIFRPRPAATAAATAD